jgi:hypothetical protein
MSWQPIETAPDGERVLVSYLFHGVRRDSQIDIKEILSDNRGDRCIWPSKYYEATHWMPLPAPPDKP